MADIPLTGGAPGQIPAGPLSSVPGPRALLSAQDLGALFAPGAVVSGRVVQPLGSDQYLLAMRGANVVVQSQTALSQDSVVRFQVVATGEQVQLRMLDGSAVDRAQTSTTAGRLQALGLPPGPASALALSAFEDAGAPLSRAPLLAAAATLAGQAQDSATGASAGGAALAGALAALARDALPATPATIAMALRALSAALPVPGATLPPVQQAAGTLLTLLAPAAAGAAAAPAAGSAAPGALDPSAPGSAAPPPPPPPATAGAPGAGAVTIGTATAVAAAVPATVAATLTSALSPAPTSTPAGAALSASAASGSGPSSATPPPAVPASGIPPTGEERVPAAGQAAAAVAPPPAAAAAAGGASAAGNAPAAIMAQGVPAAAAAGDQGAGAGTAFASTATVGAAIPAAVVNAGRGSAEVSTLGALRTLLTLSVPDATADGAPAVMQALALAGVRSSAAAGPAASLLKHLAAALPPPPAEWAAAATGGASAAQATLTQALVHAVREGSATTLVKPAALADYDQVLGVPLQDQGVAVPTRLAVASRPTAGGTATYLRVDTELSHLGAVSMRLSGIAGGPLVITLLADGGGARALAAALPALAQGLHELGLIAGLRVASLAGEDGHG